MQRSKVSGPGLPIPPGARLPGRKKKKTARNLRECLSELWTERPKIAVAVGVLLCISFIALLPGPAEDQPNIVFQFGLRQIRNFGQSKALRQIAFFVGGVKAAASYQEAKSYHESRSQSFSPPPPSLPNHPVSGVTPPRLLPLFKHMPHHRLS